MSAPEIFAVLPRDREMVQLYSPGYRPGSKPRSALYESALCGASLGHRFDFVLVADAVAWAPGTRFCRPCLGHAVVLAGVKCQTLQLIGGVL